MTRTNDFYRQQGVTGNGYIKTRTLTPVLAIVVTVFLFGAGFLLSALAENEDKIADTREGQADLSARVIILEKSFESINKKLDNIINKLSGI